MAHCFIGLGSNLGDRKLTLERALEKIRQIPHTQLLQTSRWIETDPVGGPPQERYLNGVTHLQTEIPPEELLRQLQRIEQELGRPARHPHWGPRVIDLDLLTYDNLMLEKPELTVPHPRMHERSFVLEPLSELAPAWKHPKLGKSAKALLDTRTDADR